MPSRPIKKNPLYFYALMAAVPLVLLLAAELLLRLLVADPVTHLVERIEANGQTFLRLNPRVGERFFFGGVAAIPEVYPEQFSVVKSPNTLRVFCLGSSSMASFPYELNARVSSLLQDRLQIMFPEKRVEVINAGMSAINSYAVAEFIRELVNYQPDLFVMYMGHNEFYGALGVGSTQSLGRQRWLINAYLRLQHLRTFQILRRLVLKAGAVFSSPPPSPANQSLMEGMAREKKIHLDSDAFRLASVQFRSNLEEILAVARRHRVPMIVGTLVSNLRDMEPFESDFSPQRSEDDKRRWQREFGEGWRLQRADSVAAAWRAYEQAAEIDAEPAILHYRLAQVEESNGDSTAALREYARARDLDLLRFRAPSPFNQIIREACQRQGATLVEMEQAFARQSQKGIVGHELISEHLHPNFDGYFLMAKTFADAIGKSDLLMARSQSTSAASRDDAFVRQIAAVTDFDLEIGRAKISRLTARWPFRPGQLRTSGEPVTAPIVRQEVEAYQSNKVAWNTAHMQLGDYFRNQGDEVRAICEYRAVVKVQPENEPIFMRIVDLQLKRERYDAAAATLQEALATNSASPFLHAKLGMVNFLQRHFDAAKEEFQQALQHNVRRPRMTGADIVAANYYLALSLIQVGENDAAQTSLGEVLRYQPGHNEAARLLELLRRGASVKLQF